MGNTVGIASDSGKQAQSFKALWFWPIALFCNYIVWSVFFVLAKPIIPSFFEGNTYSSRGWVVVAILALGSMPLERNLYKKLFKKYSAYTAMLDAENLKQWEQAETKRLKKVEDDQKRAKLQAEVDDENRTLQRKKKRDEQKRAKLQAEVDDENRTLQRKIQREVVKSSKCRIPEDADDFEAVCAEWMRRNGFPDAQKTPKGPDGGIDVLSMDAVAQSKFHPSNRVSAPDIQALAGSRLQHRRRIALFFHYGPGYTDQAIEAARKTKVRLYQLDVNSRSMKMIAEGPQK